MNIIASFRDANTEDFYTIGFVWRTEWHSFLTKAGHFELFVLTRPACPHDDRDAYLLPGDRISVPPNEKPKTIEQAKAVAAAWLCDYSTYCRTGLFPDSRPGSVPQAIEGDVRRDSDIDPKYWARLFGELPDANQSA